MEIEIFMVLLSLILANIGINIAILMKDKKKRYHKTPTNTPFPSITSTPSPYVTNTPNPSFTSSPSSTSSPSVTNTPNPSYMPTYKLKK
jgi:hypothetical protein